MRTGKYIRFADDTIVLFENSIFHSDISKTLHPDKEVLSAGSWLVREMSDDTQVVSVFGDSVTLHVGHRRDDKEFLIDALSSQDIITADVWPKLKDAQAESET